MRGHTGLRRADAGLLLTTAYVAACTRVNAALARPYRRGRIRAGLDVHRRWHLAPIAQGIESDRPQGPSIGRGLLGRESTSESIALQGMTFQRVAFLDLAPVSSGWRQRIRRRRTRQKGDKRASSQHEQHAGKHQQGAGPAHGLRALALGCPVLRAQPRCIDPRAAFAPGVHPGERAATGQGGRLALPTKAFPWPFCIVTVPCGLLLRVLTAHLCGRSSHCARLGTSSLLHKWLNHGLNHRQAPRRRANPLLSSATTQGCALHTTKARLGR